MATLKPKPPAGARTVLLQFDKAADMAKVSIPLAVKYSATYPAAPPAPPPPPPAPVPPPAPQTMTKQRAAAFLCRASMGPSPSHTAFVMKNGFKAYIDWQRAMPRKQSLFDWVFAQPQFRDAIRGGSPDGVDQALWLQALTGEDQLRQKLTYALTSILVCGKTSVPMLQGTILAYQDRVQDNCFGTFENLLLKCTLTHAMGAWLSYLGSRKAAPGINPDENFGREVMQLFSIGQNALNDDGTFKFDANNKRIDIYGNATVMEISRVFTGFEAHPYDADNPEYARQNPVCNEAQHDKGEKRLFGKVIPAGGTGEADVAAAINILANHPNCAPFISYRLIQHLCGSNPSKEYMKRVVAVWRTTGGNLGDVVEAILLDPEAMTTRKTIDNLCRFSIFARSNSMVPTAYGIQDQTGNGIWGANMTLAGQKSVFNFFRPDYSDPGSDINAAGLVAPENQMLNEQIVVEWMNGVEQWIEEKDTNPWTVDYKPLFAIAADATALMREVSDMQGAHMMEVDITDMGNTMTQQYPLSDPAHARKRTYYALRTIMTIAEGATR